MKSIREIQLEFLAQRLRLNAELTGEQSTIRKARDELNALLEQAGIKDGPGNMIAAYANKREDEDHYDRLRVREVVFNVPDGWLRRQIMGAINHYRSEQCDSHERLSQIQAGFVADLKQERCSPPREIGIGIGALGGVVIMCLVYWFGGALDALMIGVGVVLPFLMYRAVHHITALWQHDLTYGEAVKIVEAEAAESKAEATRRMHLPQLFSRRERTTGEPDARAEGVLSPRQHHGDSLC